MLATLMTLHFKQLFFCLSKLEKRQFDNLKFHFYKKRSGLSITRGLHFNQKCWPGGAQTRPVLPSFSTSERRATLLPDGRKTFKTFQVVRKKSHVEL